MAEEEIEEKGGSKMMIIIGAVVALGGGGAFMMMGGGEESDKPKEEIVVEVIIEKEIEGGITITFVDDEGSNNYLLINVSFVSNTEKSSELLVSKMSRIKSEINTYLYNLKAEDIQSPGAKDMVEGKLYVIMNKVLEEGKLGEGHQLKHVYVTKFIIQ